MSHLENGLHLEPLLSDRLIMKKVIFFVMIVLGSLAGTGFWLDHTLKDKGGIGHLSSAIEAIRLRSAKPGMPPDLIAREAAKANHGAMGLLKTLTTDGAKVLEPKTAPVSPSPVASTGNLEIFIRASENHDAMLSAQMTTEGESTSIKGAEKELSGAAKTGLRSTEDGREVIAVLQDGSIQDLGAVDRINAMNIPDDMREKILANYYKTGALPEIFVKETRRPASVTSPAVDDPADPRNF